MTDNGPSINMEPPRNCTCHPDDNPPKPCPRKHALSECRSAENVRMREAADGVLFHYFCCEDGDGSGCGKLRSDMAKLATLIGFKADPGTMEEIEIELSRAALGEQS